MTRAADLKHMLSNARHPGESQRAYRGRRKLAAVSVKKALQGRMVHRSCTVGSVPVAGVDPAVDEQILRGLLIVTGTVVQKGVTLRLVRTKGKTYPEAE